jgi:hypothetical protein
MARKTGTSMSYAQISPHTRRRIARARRAEERSWAARSGPVVIVRGPGEVAADIPAQYDQDGAAGDGPVDKPAA